MRAGIWTASVQFISKGRVSCQSFARLTTKAELTYCYSDSMPRPTSSLWCVLVEMEGSVGPVEANNGFRNAEANYEKEHIDGRQ